LWHLGLVDTARERSQQALALAQQLKRPNDLALAQHFAGVLNVYTRQFDHVQKYAELLLELAAREGFPFFVSSGKILKGQALAHSEHATEGVELMRDGLSGCQEIGIKLDSFAFAMLAEGQSKAGALDEALSTVEEALSYKREQVISQGYLLWLRGEILVRKFSCGAQNPTVAHAIEWKNYLTRAVDSFRSAISLARSTGDKSVELRAATSLGRIHLSTGEVAGAMEQLESVYSTFTEGFDTADLKEAQALLEELRQQT